MYTFCYILPTKAYFYRLLRALEEVKINDKDGFAILKEMGTGKDAHIQRMKSIQCFWLWPYVSALYDALINNNKNNNYEVQYLKVIKYTHTHIYIYIYIYKHIYIYILATHTHIYIYIYIYI